ncbi:DMT family transporter [Pseudoalteromonas peptidolytica]|uniref:DMT family transporter n=1 Tax=Pseudoalteromonas peptidolytica TaxID=61150 RepID=UPI00298E9F0F|nr:DMT family transporter [Pseudoalteromonas peptidolytica]MDW7548745.1 DMT family transporter [Pseudoalteromonas peptidolytica]
MNNITYFSNKRFLGMSIAVLGVVLMSFDPIFIRYSGVGGVDTVFLFGLFTAISMPIFLKFTDKRGVYRAIKESGWPLLFASSLMLISSSSFVISVKNTTVANTFLILATTPVFSALFSHVFLKEKLGKAAWITIGFVLLGVLIVAKGSLGSLNLLGDSMALLSVSSLALMFVLLRKYQNVSRVAAVALAGALLAVVMFPQVEPSNYSSSTWAVMAAMGLFSAPIGRALSMTATNYISASEVSMTLVLEAVFAMFWAYLFFKEIPSINSITGGVVILSSIVAYTWLSLKASD